MVMRAEPLGQDIDPKKVPQFGVVTSILIFAWPAVWFTLLIYVIGRQFIPEGDTVPTWLLLLITVFGAGLN